MSRFRFLLVFLVGWGVLASASCTRKNTQYAVTYAEKRAVLHANGLRVIVMPDDSTELIEVDMHYLVGGREDPPGKAGLAHLVEHLMFDIRPEGPGTPTLMTYIQRISLFYNAGTTQDMTHYQVRARKSALEPLIKMEAMRLYYGCQTITPEEFAREREVVRNEIRQRAEMNGPIGQLVLENVYPKGHPYSRSTGGNDTTLSNLTLEDACAFMKNYYVPERATLIVAGNVKPDEVITLAQKYFAPIPKRKPAPRVKVPPVKLSRHTIVKKLGVERTVVTVAWVMPPPFSDRGYAVELASNMITSRLARFARDWDFAASITPTIQGGLLAPLFLVSVELTDDADVDEALDYIWKAAEGAHRPFNDRLMQFLRPQWAGRFVQGLEPLGARTQRVAMEVQFDHDVAWESDKAFLMENLTEIKAMNGDEISDLIQDMLDPDKAVVVVVKPDPDAPPIHGRTKLSFSPPDHGNRGDDLPVDPKSAYKPLPMGDEAEDLTKLAEARRFSLDNGLDVILMPLPTLPVVSAMVMLNVGGADEPADKAGLADVAASLRIQRVSEASIKASRAGVSIGSMTTDDTTIFGASGMNIYLEEILEALERYVKTGKYEQNDIEKWQRQVRHRFEDIDVKESMAVTQALYSALYGEDHPYTKKGTLLPSTLGNIDRDSLTEFADDHYNASNATLVVTGSFDVKAAEELIRDLFDSWDSGDTNESVSQKRSPRTAPAFIGVVGEKREQVEVTIAYPSQAGIDGQHAARLIIAQMLNLRMGAVRKELGASYGVYARRQTKVGPSAYVMGGMVDAARAGEALAAMREGVASLRRGENFLEDFVRARREVYQQLLTNTTVSSAVGRKLARGARYNLPLGFYSQLLKQVAVMSPAQVKALIAQELAPAGEVVVALGGKSDVTTMFAAAKIDTPTVITVE